MTHVLDHMAHAALRGFVYRVIWYSPMLLAVGLALLAAVYLARRFP